MESHSPREPTPADARAALSTLDADGERLAGRVVTPWWYHVSLGAIVAAFVASQALPAGASAALLALGILALPLLTTIYSRRYGLTITQPAGRRSRRLLLSTLAILISAMACGVVIKLTGAEPWWVLAPAAVAFAATVVLGRRYDDALRGELARPGTTPA